MRFIKVGTLVFGMAVAGACGAHQQPDPEPVESIAEPEPECMPSCQLDIEGQCVAIARSMDPAGRVEAESIECDSRCCEGQSLPEETGVQVDSFVPEDDEPAPAPVPEAEEIEE